MDQVRRWSEEIFDVADLNRNFFGHVWKVLFGDRAQKSRSSTKVNNAERQVQTGNLPRTVELQEQVVPTLREQSHAMEDDLEMVLQRKER